MKSICSCLIILTFFASCANDENVEQELLPTAMNKGGGITMPANSDNPYDNAGRIYDEIFDVYYNGNVRPTATATVITTIEELAEENACFAALSPAYQPVSAERVDYLAGKKIADVPATIGSSNLSGYGRVNFSNFLISFAALYGADVSAETLFATVTKYEAEVIANALLTAEDKRIILTTTSIARYSAYRAKKKPKKNTDPDWIIFVTHVLAAEEGAEENTPKAIIQSLATGVIANK